MRTAAYLRLPFATVFRPIACLRPLSIASPDSSASYRTVSPNHEAPSSDSSPVLPGFVR